MKLSTVLTCIAHNHVTGKVAACVYTARCVYFTGNYLVSLTENKHYITIVILKQFRGMICSVKTSLKINGWKSSY